MAELEKVKEHLKEIAEYFRGCRSNASFASKAENHFLELQNAASEAAELLKAYEPGWISVKDRLPEEKGEYLTAYHPCHWDNVDYHIVQIDKDTWRGQTTWAKKKYHRVTHWMPMPEPAKEET